METLKIIALVLLCEAVLYYLYTCYVKWSTAFHSSTKEIFNPFVSRHQADYHKEWQKGYSAHREKIEKEYKKAGWLKEDQMLL